jgi:hypothetical protein
MFDLPNTWAPLSAYLNQIMTGDASPGFATT